MKIKFILTGIILSALLAACTGKKESTGISLSNGWKFHTGDDPAWATPGFNDNDWDTINPAQVWESQGHEGYSGFAWYRKHVIIPSSLKENGHLKDTLRIRLGRIDDCDQVFMNGALIGENGKTIFTGTGSGQGFIKEQGIWNLPRVYSLPVNDPRIKWDQDNVIAVRCYDQGGIGGMFSKPFEIVMASAGDYIVFDLSSTAYEFSGDSMVTKKFEIINLSGKEEFRGRLRIEAFLDENLFSLYSESTGIDITPAVKMQKTIRFRKDIAKPATLRITFTENSTGESVIREFTIPYILTPAVPAAPRITGASVFGVRPWSPFQFKVTATGEKPLKYRAENLPAGLKIDSVTGLITGSLSKRDTMIVGIIVENRAGRAERDLTVIVGDVISLTPPLGWNSWNCWGLSVSDQKIRQSADAMVASGLIDHGWTYINIDDGWEDKHDKDGQILTNYKFPNMRALCNYVHSLGLKIGIYSSPGPKTCGGYEGSYTYEEKDAQAYASWGIDYLKYDWCSYGSIAPKPTPEQLKAPYRLMKHALRKVNRDIHYSLCQYGMGEVWTWGANVDGNSWRTTGDIEDTWESLSTIGFSQDKCSPYAAPGRWNDPDMLVVGWVGWGPALHYTRLTTDEQYTHITLWSLLASPLLIGCDLTQLDAFTLNLLTNDEVLAVNQDPLGKQARRIKKTAEYEVWARDLADGGIALGLFNLTDHPIQVPVDLADLNVEGKWSMRDLWRQYDLGKVYRHFEMKTQPHGARMVKLSK